MGINGAMIHHAMAWGCDFSQARGSWDQPHGLQETKHHVLGMFVMGFSSTLSLA
jgi:hypothetical protein